MTEIARKHIDDRQRVLDSLNKISAASRSLMSLVNEVLDMSKIEAGRAELSNDDFTLPELIDNVLSVIRPQADAHGHALRIYISKLAHEEVSGDFNRLQQVFNNLMGNAVKYTPDGGRITLSLREIPSHREGICGYEFTIEDNGIGMTEEFVSRIFEPFTRAEDSRINKIQGTGLGMTIARSTVRMMNGDIRVTSRLNEGTVFTVTVFLKQRSENSPSCAMNGLNVLVIDSDRNSLLSISGMLSMAGANADTAITAREALTRIDDMNRKNAHYSAVMISAGIPGISVADIRNACPDVCVILMTEPGNEASCTSDADRIIPQICFKSTLEKLFADISHPHENSMPLSQEASYQLAGLKCLLVEDNDLNAEIACELLSMDGIDVCRVSDGLEAIHAIEDAPDGEFDLVLTDIQMPRMNGLDTARTIRAMKRPSCAGLPIIAMSANAFADDMQAAKAAGINGYAAKPVDMQTLRKTIVSVLKK